jgi:hypothetical protein
MIARMKDWVDHLRKNGHRARARIEALRAEYDASAELDDLPF